MTVDPSMLPENTTCRHASTSPRLIPELELTAFMRHLDGPVHTRQPAKFIGVFDSGIGGLAVYRAVRALIPDVDVVYIADSGHAPYGDRSLAFISRRVATVTDALVAHGACAIVVACNTATVTTISALRARHALPIVGIEPAIKPAVNLSRSGRLVVLTTQRTAESEAVARLCALHGANAKIIIQPCPGLADRVEAGDLDGEATRDMLRHYLAPALAGGVDTVVLGCTHFTFLDAQMRDVLGTGVTIVEPSGAVARQLARQLDAHYRPHAQIADGPSIRDVFLTTAKIPAQASEIFSKLLGRTVEVGSSHMLGIDDPT